MCLGGCGGRGSLRDGLRVAPGGRGRQVYLRPDLQGRDNGGGSKASCGHAITRLDRSRREDSDDIKESSRGRLNRWPSSSKVYSTEAWNPVSFVAQAGARVQELRE
jgi:hypothetical protein